MRFKETRSMKKKSVALVGLVTVTAASALGVAFALGNKNVSNVFSLNEASGSNIERTLVVEDVVHSGLYYMKNDVVEFDNSSVTFNLDNAGGYGLINLFDDIPPSKIKDYNINDGLFEFKAQSSTKIIINIDLQPLTKDYYATAKDCEDGVNKLPIFNFGMSTLDRVLIKMGSRTTGYINTSSEDVSYDTSTKTYTYKNPHNATKIMLSSTENGAVFHVKSMTFIYTC